jgi:amino acid adenylation domain-containing protein/non-ribosomal peptide synthase protein (TIGR01720 family)
MPMQDDDVPGFRLSQQQQRVLRAQRIEDRLPCCVAYVSLGPDVDVARLHSVIGRVIAAHEILRTLYRATPRSSAVLQIPTQQLGAGLVDARGKSDEDSQKAARIARSQINTETGPLLSCRLIDAAAGGSELVLALPRISADRRAIEQLAAEIQSSYAEGTQCPVQELQYVDYAEWQHELQPGETGEQARKFWEDICKVSPVDRRVRWERETPAPSIGVRCNALWSEDVEASIGRLSDSSGLERHDVVFVLWGAFLARVEERSRIVVALQEDARTDAVAGVLGPFSLDIPVMVTLDADTSVRKLLRTVSLEMEASRSWLHYFHLPSGLAAEDGAYAFGFTRPPARRPDIRTEVDEPQDFKLRLEYRESDFLNLMAPEAVFDATALDIRAEQFRTFILNAASDIERTAADIELVGAAERQRILQEFNVASMALATEPPIHRLIEATAAANGDADAIAFGDQVWSYRQLNARANRLAHRLREWNVGPEALVAICATRSFDLVVGVLAVLKAGGGYLPIDPSYPSERIAHMLSDSKPRVVLTQIGLLERLPDVDARVWAMDAADADLGGMPDGNLESVSPRSLAYCIYTSGSTGRPKACQIEHASLTRYLLWANEHYFATEKAGGCFGLYSSLSFDLTVTSLFLPLLRGKCLRVFEEDAPVDDILARSFAPGSGLDAVKLTPSHISLLRSLQLPRSDVSLAIVGGEALLPEQVRVLHDLNPRMRVFNEYGPTEATVGCVVQLVTPDDQTVLIGRPIEGCRVYVLDRRGELAPLGTTGELYIAGVGLARGYGGRPALTAEKFVPDLYSDAPGARAYRTGDLVRYRPDGALEYVGRADHQVKIRGHRIELGEIEARLVQLPEVREAAVVVHEARPGERRLVAYIVSELPVIGDAGAQLKAKETLRTGLQQLLPDYMVPAQFAFVSHLPLNPHGKVDRKALPAPNAIDLNAEAVAPRNATETVLAQIWMQVLKLERVGVHDNFFELGGDSIVALQVVSKARTAGLSFAPRDMFQHPSIAALAIVARPLDNVVARTEELAGDVPLTPIQHAFFELPLERRDHWNQSVLLRLDQPLDSAMLEASLQRLVEHHGALRLRFERHPDGSWRQWQEPNQRMPLAASIRIDTTAEVESRANEVQRSLDLKNGPLLRAVQMILPDGSARLLIAIHHLVVDGVSWRILLEDLQAVYRAFETQAPVRLAAKSDAFLTWARALRSYADSDALASELGYWRDVVRSHERTSTTTGLPVSAKVRHIRTVELDERCTRELLTRAHVAYRTRINDLLLVALTRVLCEWTGSDEVLVEVEGHGREDVVGDVDVTRTVGWFTSIYPLRLARVGSDHHQAIRSIKEQLRAVPRNGIGYGALRYLQGRQELQCVPDSIVARFNHLGQFDASFDASAGWRLADESSGDSRSRGGDIDDALDWDTLVYEGKLRIRCAYVEGACEASQIDQLLDRYAADLRALVNHCLDAKGALSPADVPLATVTQQQLDRLPVAVRDMEDIYPLTPMQQGLLLHTLLNKGSGMYLMQDVFETAHALDPDRVRRAWNQVVDRHAILRTSFWWEEDALPLQIVHRAVPSPVQFLDWSGMQPAAARERLQLLLREELGEGFDVTRPCLSRLRLIKVSANRFLLAHSFHHLLMDAWCRSLLFRDFFECYSQDQSNKAASHPQPRRYRDFIEWLGKQDRERARLYWREELSGFTDVTPAPLARRVPSTSLSTVEGVMEQLTAAETQALNRFAQEQRLTVNTLVQGAWAVVLALHAGRNEVLFGVTVAGRPTELTGIEDTLGLFINSLPLRVRLPQPGEQVSVSEWLRALLAKNVTMRQHEHLPLVEVQSLSEIAPGSSLFDTLFVFENAPFEASVASQARALDFEGLSGRTHTNYPLTVVATPGPIFFLELSFDQRCYDLESATRVLRQFKDVIVKMIASPHAAWSEVDWLADTEQKQLHDFEAIEAGQYSLQESLVERFSEQVRVRGAATAVRCGREELSYRQLSDRTNHIAAVLNEQSVKRDDVIAVYGERGLDLLTMILAVFHSGASYLAVEPGYPAHRLRQVLSLASPRLVLTTEPQREWLAEALREMPGSSPPPVVTLESLASRAVVRDFACPPTLPRQLAYIIYTSGSTGVPKGVMVEHAGMLNNQLSKIVGLRLDATDVIAQTASCSFDISVWQLLTPLLCGARVEILPDAIAHDPLRLLGAVRDCGITVLESVPSLVEALLLEDKVELPTLRYLIVTGEALPVSLARRWLERYPNIPLLNAYGPAECSDDVSMHELTAAPPASAASVPIGRATPNNGLLVLGNQLQRLPPGAIGEICVRGTGVGRGYLRDPQRTAERFVPNPYSDSGERLYRTGDLGRYGADGALEYLGRNDQQVKILGHRIEPGEVESRLSQCVEVAAAAVVVVQQEGVPARLVACVVPTGQFADTESQASLREQLRTTLLGSLPRYMVPAEFVWLDALPLNANGKIDRRELSAMTTRAQRPVGIAPRNPTETQLAQIWKEVLKLPDLDIHADFFELGGHSLLVTQVASRIRHRLGVELPLRTLFEASTIAALAHEVERASSPSGGAEEMSLMSSLLESLEAT